MLSNLFNLVIVSFNSSTIFSVRVSFIIASLVFHTVLQYVCLLNIWQLCQVPQAFPNKLIWSLGVKRQPRSIHASATSLTLRLYSSERPPSGIRYTGHSTPALRYASTALVTSAKSS